jgi:transcription antitermination factor NusG
MTFHVTQPSGFWAVVQAEAQREHITRLLLMRLGFETYMPRIKVRNRICLLFPSYIFVRIIDRWYPILWTAHVVRLLMAGDKPACLKEEIMANIRKREVNGFVKLPIPDRRLKAGQKVRIVSGSFAGQVGLYQGQTSREREKVLLEFLGQVVPVELPGKDIAPLHLADQHRLRY